MSGYLSRVGRRWFGARLRLRLRLRRGRRAAGGAGVERLEGRVLLTPGSALWNMPADFAPGGNDYFTDVAVQADGKVVAIGTALIGGDRDFLVARYTADGRPDAGFNHTGSVTINFGSGFDDFAAGVVIQPDGKILVVGQVSEPDTAGVSIGMVRFLRDGRLDTTFGTSGRVIQRHPGGVGYLQPGGDGVALTADGGILVGGRQQVGIDPPTFGVVYKFTAAGAKDNAFAGVGYREVFTSNNEYVKDLAVDALGRVVAVGNRGTVARLTSSGALDSAFSSDGFTSVSFDVGTGPRVAAVALAADGKIVVGGYAYDGTSNRPGLVRLLADGSLDNTFDGNGRSSFDPTANVGDELTDLAVLPNGGIVAAGHDNASGGYGWVAVVKPEGVLDGGFAGDGTSVWSGGGGEDDLHGVAVTSAGHYAVAGEVDTGDELNGGVALIKGRFGRRDDLLGWTDAGDWYAAGSTGGGFLSDAFGRWNRDAGWRTVETADLDGDGDADVLGRDSTGQWWVGRNTGSAFATVAGAKWNEAAGWRDLRVADFDGDGRADVAARTSTGQWWVSRSTGTGLANGQLWAKWNEGAQWRDVLAADFDGDGRSDLAGRTSGGQWYVGLSTGSGFSLALWDTWGAGAGWRDVAAGDFNGDGLMDIAGRASNGQWFVARSTVLFAPGRVVRSFSTSHWGTWGPDAGWVDVGVGDFDGDGRDDLIGRAGDGQWFVARGEETGFSTSRWGRWGTGAGWRDVTIGDYDGDGRSDVAGRTSGGEWYVARGADRILETSRWGKWNEAAGWTTFGGELVPTA